MQTRSQKLIAVVSLATLDYFVRSSRDMSVSWFMNVVSD